MAVETIQGWNYLIHNVPGIPRGVKAVTAIRQTESLRAIRDFMSSASRDHVYAKRRATKSSVNRWLKEEKPASAFAKWQADSTCYKDDVVEVYYVPG